MDLTNIHTQNKILQRQIFPIVFKLFWVDDIL